MFPGGGGSARASADNGFNASEYGGGGQSLTSGVARSGGNGMQGIIIVWEYA